MESNPVVRKLQTLPILYASRTDLVLVSKMPHPSSLQLQTFERALKANRIESWGASLAISKWAKERNIPYLAPDWQTVRTINSKLFSFSHSPSLAGSSLLHNQEEVRLWISKTSGPKVLKTLFGTAGRGHCHIPGKKDIGLFCDKEFKEGRPILAEPWVERVFDFSSQWYNKEFLGATVLQNTPHGQYRTTLVGDETQIFGDYMWALREHLEVARPLVGKILDMGFFGNLGIDAFVYQEGKKMRVHPVVEINGRKTMGWVALELRKKSYPNQSFLFSFHPSDSKTNPIQISPI